MQFLTEVTRRDIIDKIKLRYFIEDHLCIGRLDEIEFLGKLYDLDKLYSTDNRFENCEDDIYQHRYNNADWEDWWFFHDSRFELKVGEDEIFLKLICYLFHPVVLLSNFFDADLLRWEINDYLKADGYEMIVEANISGRPVYGWQRIEEDFIEKPVSKVSKQKIDLQKIGEGSYAFVSKFHDDFYDDWFVYKKLKPKMEDKNIERFKEEFEILKKIKSPFVIKVYSYFENKQAYIMELADSDLDSFIRKNPNLSFDSRKALGMQLINGIRHIHDEGLFHRDISPGNILIKKYRNFNMIKIADFGLVKLPKSNKTSLNTEFKGSFNDPNLNVIGFSNYSISHELYALTWNLYFILTGSINCEKCKNEQISEFVKKGMVDRFSSLEELKICFSKLKSNC